MKQFFIMLCLVPLAGLAQHTIIKDVLLPKLEVDSTTKLRTLWVNAPAPGAKKDKLVIVLNKWLADNYTAIGNASKPTGDDAATLHGEGFFSASVAAQRQQYDANATDRVVTNVPPVDYKVKFTIVINVADEKYTIVITRLKLELFNVISPFEAFYNGTIPNIPIPEEERGTDIGEMYVRMFRSINLSLQDIGKSASKYIAKAKKKGEL